MHRLGNFIAIFLIHSLLSLSLSLSLSLLYSFSASPSSLPTSIPLSEVECDSLGCGVTIDVVTSLVEIAVWDNKMR